MAKRNVTNEETPAMNIREQEINKRLTFELTQEEIAQKAKDAGELQREIVKLTHEFSQLKKAWKGRIETKQMELSKILDLVNEGVEERDVVAICRKDYDRLTVQYLFNGQLMEERAMSIEERQLELDFERRRREAKEKGEDFETGEFDDPQSSFQQDVKDVMRLETNKKTKVDLVV